MIAAAAAVAQETAATGARVESKTLLLIVLAALGLATQVMQHFNESRPVITQTIAPKIP
jgi:hypothetical protein